MPVALVHATICELVQPRTVVGLVAEHTLVHLPAKRGETVERLEIVRVEVIIDHLALKYTTVWTTKDAVVVVRTTFLHDSACRVQPLLSNIWPLVEAPVRVPDGNDSPELASIEGAEDGLVRGPLFPDLLNARAIVGFYNGYIGHAVLHHYYYHLGLAHYWDAATADIGHQTVVNPLIAEAVGALEITLRAEPALKQVTLPCLRHLDALVEVTQ